jgi:hypothetical protein
MDFADESEDEEKIDALPKHRARTYRYDPTVLAAHADCNTTNEDAADELKAKVCIPTEGTEEDITESEGQCDDEEPGYDAPAVSPPVTISWLPVTMSHPDTDGAGAGVNPPVPVTIHNYEVVVEAEFDIGDDEFTSVLSIILPPGTTAFDVPASITSLSDSFKYEVLAREQSFNQTAVESCYEID